MDVMSLGRGEATNKSLCLPSGFAKGGSRERCLPVFFSEKKTERNRKKKTEKTEKKNGKKRKIPERKQGKKRTKTERKQGKTEKKNKKTEENGNKKKRKKSEATRFRRPLLRNPDCQDREEHSMDRCRCRPELSDLGVIGPCAFQREIHMDQSLGLRTRRPPTGVFGPFGPEVPLGVSERVSPKIGVCPKVSGEVPLGPF